MLPEDRSKRSGHKSADQQPKLPDPASPAFQEWLAAALRTFYGSTNVTVASTRLHRQEAEQSLASLPGVLAAAARSGENPTKVLEKLVRELAEAIDEPDDRLVAVILTKHRSPGSLSERRDTAVERLASDFPDRYGSLSQRSQASRDQILRRRFEIRIFARIAADLTAQLSNTGLHESSRPRQAQTVRVGDSDDGHYGAIRNLAPLPEAEALIAKYARRTAAPTAWWAIHPRDINQRQPFWAGNVLVFWHVDSGHAASRFRYVVDLPLLDPKTYESVPEVTVQQAGRTKLALAGCSDFLGDSPWYFSGGPIHYEFVRWVERNHQKFVNENPEPSPLGNSISPWPALTVVHLALTTADGYLLMARRSKAVSYLASHWSITVEEQVEVGNRKSGSGDQTVLDTVLAGLDEELGIGPREIDTVDVVAFGREVVPPQSNTELNLRPDVTILNGAIFAEVDLRLRLKEFRDLQFANTPEDRVEIDSIIALSVPTQDVAMRLFEAMGTADRQYRSIQDLAHGEGLEVQHVFGDHNAIVEEFLLHPTSLARLFFWSRSHLSRAPVRSRDEDHSALRGSQF